MFYSTTMPLISTENVADELFQIKSTIERKPMKIIRQNIQYVIRDTRTFQEKIQSTYGKYSNPEVSLTKSILTVRKAEKELENRRLHSHE